MWYIRINCDTGATFVRFPTFFVSPEGAQADFGANTAAVREAPGQGVEGSGALTFLGGLLHP